MLVVKEPEAQKLALKLLVTEPLRLRLGEAVKLLLPVGLMD